MLTSILQARLRQALWRSLLGDGDPTAEAQNSMGLWLAVVNTPALRCRFGRSLLELVYWTNSAATRIAAHGSTDAAHSSAKRRCSP